jgi:hypothetical protein
MNEKLYNDLRNFFNIGDNKMAEEEKYVRIRDPYKYYREKARKMMKCPQGFYWSVDEGKCVPDLARIERAKKKYGEKAVNDYVSRHLTRINSVPHYKH